MIENLGKLAKKLQHVAGTSRCGRSRRRETDHGLAGRMRDALHPSIGKKLIEYNSAGGGFGGARAPISVPRVLSHRPPAASLGEGGDDP